MKTSPPLIALVGIMLGCQYFFQRYKGEKPPLRALMLISFLRASGICVGVWGLWTTFSN